MKERLERRRRRRKIKVEEEKKIRVRKKNYVSSVQNWEGGTGSVKKEERMMIGGGRKLKET